MVGLTREQRAEREERSRSAAGLSVDEAHREGIVMGDDRDPNTAVIQERVRIPVNSGQNLSLRGYVLDQANFHYRWVHEEPTRPGRVEAYKGAFYEHCQLHGENLTTPSGGGIDYLMRLPRKYWNDDMLAAKAKRDALKRRENTLKPGEYTTDKHGRAVDTGEVNVRRSVSDNPYA